jgi:CheY-like chemotaxis protein
MTPPRVLIVDDQRDILRLIRASLETLGHDLKIVEAPSGEEAMLEASNHKIDLLISDYKLPGITGVELMTKIRARTPDVKVILITAMTDRRTRDEIRNAGALANFDKPIPLADFLDTVERALGFKRTLLIDEAEVSQTQGKSTLSGMLAGLRQKIGAQAVFLLSDRGRVMERAGDLYDTSMEVSLFSALMAIFSAGHKAARIMHMNDNSHFHTFAGEEHDLLLMPISSLYALVISGEKLAAPERVDKAIDAMRAAREGIEKSLRSLGVPTAPAEQTEADQLSPLSGSLNVPTQDLAAMLSDASTQKKDVDADAFWNDAVEKHGNPPLKADHLSYEQAKKLGLAPKKGNTKPFDKK